MIFLRAIVVLTIGTVGGIWGGAVVESTLLAYFIGVITASLILLTMEGV